MTQSQLTFSILYQVPAILIGSVIGSLVPFQSIRAMLLLPGTFIHEIMHLVVGFLTFGEPVSINLIPYKTTNGNWVMGSVEFVNIRWYNAVFIGLAPLLAPLIAIAAAPSGIGWQIEANDMKYWVAASPVFLMCMPSRADIKIACISWAPIVIGAAGLATWLHNFK